MDLALRKIDSFSKDEPIESHLCVLFEQFCCQAQAEGLKILPYRTSPLENLRRRSENHKERVLENFRSYYEICAETIKEGFHLRDSLQLAWRAFGKLKLLPPSDIFDKIDLDCDVIEIYSPEGIQIFRNLRFFDICSYTLDEIFAYDWPELYSRELAITQGILSLVEKMFEGKIQVTTPANIEIHTVKEIFSEERNEYIIEQKLFSPVLRVNKTIGGVLGTFSILGRTFGNVESGREGRDSSGHTGHGCL